MSAIAGSAGNAINQEVSSSRDGFADISSNEFMEIMFAELAQQDPFEPQDSQAMLQQLSTIRDIESNIDLQENLERMVEQNGLASAASFIGKYVTGQTADNRSITGFVEGLKVQDGKATLQLNTGETIAIERITDVVEEPGMIDPKFQAMLERLGLSDAWQLSGRSVLADKGSGETYSATIKDVDIDGQRVRLLLDNDDMITPDKVISMI